jgi:hypothetical protein
MRTVSLCANDDSRRAPKGAKDLRFALVADFYSIWIISDP